VEQRSSHTHKRRKGGEKLVQHLTRRRSARWRRRNNEQDEVLGKVKKETKVKLQAGSKVRTRSPPYA